jgi:hypothetical protein
MNKILATVTVVVALASPAFAQSYDSDLGSGNIVPPEAQYTPGESQGASARRNVAPRYNGSFDAYAQEPAWNGLPVGPVVPTDSGRRIRTDRR